MMMFTKLNLTNQLIIGALFCFSSSLLGQSQELYQYYKNLYPNSSVVTLNKVTKVRIKIKDNNIDILQEFFEEDLYLDEGANKRSKKSLNFSSFFELNTVEASSFIPEKGKFKETIVSDFSEKDDLNQSFYDDSKSLNFIFPKLQKGAKSQLKYSESVKNPRFLSPFYFGDFSPVVLNKFVIIADKNVNLKFKTFNTEGLQINYNTEKKRNTTIHTWELQNIKAFKYESGAPTYKKIFPHVVPIIASYKVKEDTIKLADTVDDLYKWYYNLTKDINKDAASLELTNVVERITENKPNDFEKVKAIYYWAQKNIKYIAFEYALGGFIPRQANDVFEKKYGDCKDNSSILYKMLDVAGIKGNLTWIGTRKIPYNYEDVPTPIVDNHMILSYTDAKDITYFLDATGRFIPIDYPTPFIQGKEALIALGKDNYIIKKVPVVTADRNTLVDTTEVRLIDENLVGSSKTEVSGYVKLDYFNILESLKNEEKNKTFYINQFEKGNNRFIIEKFIEKNKFDYDKNFSVNYNFSIGKYAKKLKDELYINLNLNKELTYYRTDKDRKNEIEFDYKNCFSYTTKFYVAKGYKVDYIPENITLTTDILNTSITYTLKDNIITYTHKAEVDFISLNLEEQKAVNKLVKSIENAYKEVIVLKKI